MCRKVLNEIWQNKEDIILIIIIRNGKIWEKLFIEYYRITRLITTRLNAFLAYLP